MVSTSPMFELAQPTGVVSRLRHAIGSAVQRLLGVGLPTYSTSGGGSAVEPPYSVETATAAMARNPYVWACVQAIATDLSGLPLVAESGSGAEVKQDNDHWLLWLLARPHPKVGGRKFRKQLIFDLKLAGNAFIRVYRDGSARPIMLSRIPPKWIKPIVGKDGEELGWELTATQKRLAWDDVLHIADATWDQNEGLIFGASPIVPLAMSLQVEIDSKRNAGRAARRGKLDMVLSPKEDGYFSPEGTDAIRNQYVAQMEGGDGVYVVNRAVDAVPVSLSAREGEFMAMSAATKAEILAVFGVPNTRIADPAANYGTAKQQMRTYWETLAGVAALIDDELSRLAEPGVRIKHSFANTEALQSSYTERQNRAVVWREKFGMNGRVAAKYEGFADVPLTGDEVVASAPATAPDPAAKDPSVNEPQVTNDTSDFLTRDVLSALKAAQDMAIKGLDADFWSEMLRTQLAGVAHLHRFSGAPVLGVIDDTVSVVVTVVQDHGAVGPVFGASHAASIAEQIRGS